MTQQDVPAPSAFTLSREELVRLVGEDVIMASTAIMPEGHWKLRADGRWGFIPEENDWSDA